MFVPEHPEKFGRSHEGENIRRPHAQSSLQCWGALPSSRARRTRWHKSVLRARPNVDADRIAFVGGSRGAATGALFVGIERRLRAAVFVVGHGGQVSLHTGPPNGKVIKNLGCAKGVAWIRAMAPIEPIRFVGNANVPLLMQNGASDESIRTADAEAFHAAAPQPKDIRWYNSGHNLPLTARVDAHRWLHEKIGVEAP